MRNHFKALVRLSSSGALRTDRRTFATIFPHFDSTGPGTDDIAVKGLRAQSHAPKWSISPQPLPSRRRGPMRGPGTSGSSRSARSPRSPTSTPLTFLSPLATPWSPPPSESSVSSACSSSSPEIQNGKLNSVSCETNVTVFKAVQGRTLSLTDSLTHSVSQVLISATSESTMTTKTTTSTMTTTTTTTSLTTMTSKTTKTTKTTMTWTGSLPHFLPRASGLETPTNNDHNYFHYYEDYNDYSDKRHSNFDFD